MGWASGGTTPPRCTVQPRTKPSLCPTAADAHAGAPPHPRGPVYHLIMSHPCSAGGLSSPGGAVGGNLFQQDGLAAPRLPPWGQHLQHCAVVGAEEQNRCVAVGTSRTIHGYLGQEGPGGTGLESGQVDQQMLACSKDSPGTQPGPFPPPRVSIFAPSLPFSQVLPPADVIYLVGSKEKRLRGEGSGQHFTAPYLLVRVSRGWRVAGGTAGSSSG